jgi:hypothetical protein
MNNIDLLAGHFPQLTTLQDDLHLKLDVTNLLRGEIKEAIEFIENLMQLDYHLCIRAVPRQIFFVVCSFVVMTMGHAHQPHGA